MKYEKGQFVTVPNVKYLTGLKGNTTAVYLWICTYSDQDGRCYPKRKTIAEKIDADVRTVDRSIVELCEKGLLEKTSRFNGKEQSSNQYQILIIEDKEDVEGGDKNDTGGATKTTYPQRQKRHTELNPINQIQITKQNNKFDVWWAAYPKRRVDKEKCKLKFSKFPEDIQALIIQDTQNRASQDDKWIKGFVPMTSTYLNNKKWEDDYEKVEEKTTGVKVYE